MERHWKVYVHINEINNKRYVGITSKQKPEHRWNSGRGYAYNSRFYNAIQKYGWDSFNHVILFSDFTEEQAKEMERFLIALWGTTDDRYGYNLTSGGEGTCGFRPSDETRLKLSNARRRENLSEETLRRRSKSLSGRKFSDEHKLKIGKSNSKPIEMYSKGNDYIRSFDSARDAEIVTGVSHSHISQCCNGKRNSAGGYIWRFAQ